MRSATRIKVNQRLKRAHYARDAVSLAQELLGCTLVRIGEDGERLAGVIVETEAYLGVEDRAAHCFGGRRTMRNESMYGPPGLAYVYFTYGMHYCMNVVCGEPEEPVAVLLRALEPVEGVEMMRRNRTGPRRRATLTDTDLCSGPAKLCQALQIDRALDGEDLCRSERLFIEPSPTRRVSTDAIVASPRIGVDYAGEWALRPLRFHLSKSSHVSRK